MKYRGRKMTPEEFGEIVIRATSDGQVLRLKDVADIELGQDSYAYHGMVNGHPGVSALVFQTAGTNATQTVEEIDAMLDEIATELPKGVEITHLMSVNDYLYASIHEVIKTLIEAIILVILVVYVFLQDIRSTLIPTISILVSLVGTFAFLSFAGFSINLLTLFALEVLTLVFGGLGRRRTMVVFSATKRAAVDEMFNELQSREYAVISYEVEAQRSADGIVYRATLVIRAKGNTDEDRYVDLLRENPDITIERIV